MRISVAAKGHFPIRIVFPTALICSRTAAKIIAKYSELNLTEAELYAALKALSRSKKSLRGMPLVDVRTEDVKVKIWV